MPESPDDAQDFANLLARPPRPVFTPLPKPSRRLLYLALVILTTLISLLAFQLRSQNLENTARQERLIIDQARGGLDAAQKLAGVNDNLARETLTQTKNNLLVTAKNKNLTGSKNIQAVLDQLDKQLAVVGHIYQIKSLDIFSDFNLLRSNSVITSAGWHQHQMAVLDSANGAVYSLGTQSKTAAIVGGTDDFKNSGSVDFTGDKAYVYTPNGIYFLSLASPGAPKQLAKPAEKFGQILSLKAFGGNLYLLDTANSQIWKYQGTDFGLASPSAYLKTSAVDFSRVVDWAIDGSVWVLSSSGNVSQFSGGSPQDFNLSGLDKPLSAPAGIFTTDDTNNVYVLDSGRVVVFDKKGVYQGQYLIPNTPKPLKLILADETAKKVFLPAGNLVYSFALK